MGWVSNHVPVLTVRWMGSWGAMTPKPQVGLGNTPGAQNEVYGHLRCPQ